MIPKVKVAQGVIIGIGVPGYFWNLVNKAITDRLLFDGILLYLNLTLKKLLSNMHLIQHPIYTLLFVINAKLKKESSKPLSSTNN